MDLLTTPYAFDAEQAALTEAGVDILVAHMGLTTSGTIGAETSLTLEDCVPRIAEIRGCSTIRMSSCYAMVAPSRCHPMQFHSRAIGLRGRFRTSSMERLPQNGHCTSAGLMKIRRS